jgi:signal peptidase I
MKRIRTKLKSAGRFNMHSFLVSKLFWLRKRIVKGLVFLGAIILLAIFIRVVMGEPCRVPSNSMEPVIQPGDWLWIDKLSYGARLPQRWADIPIINVFTHIDTWRAADEKINWGYHRFPGFKKPEVSDIVVFNSPENEDLLLVKRVSKIEERDGRLYYYLRGDNTEVSRDSRFFGWVPERLIVGRIFEKWQ